MEEGIFRWRTQYSHGGEKVGVLEAPKEEFGVGGLRLAQAGEGGRSMKDVGGLVVKKGYGQGMKGLRH